MVLILRLAFFALLVAVLLALFKAEQLARWQRRVPRSVAFGTWAMVIFGLVALGIVAFMRAGQDARAPEPGSVGQVSREITTLNLVRDFQGDMTAVEGPPESALTKFTSTLESLRRDLARPRDVRQAASTALEACRRARDEFQEMSPPSALPRDVAAHLDTAVDHHRRAYELKAQAMEKALAWIGTGAPDDGLGEYRELMSRSERELRMGVEALKKARTAATDED
jgi:Xaa-Pro aminopeptidase